MEWSALTLIILSVLYYFIFQGGGKNLELLNSVSRGNYTMLTFRRPVAALDRFDTPVFLDREQQVFWSVGYKNPEMRKRNKPVKNKV